VGPAALTMPIEIEKTITTRHSPITRVRLKCCLIIK